MLHARYEQDMNTQHVRIRILLQINYMPIKWYTLNGEISMSSSLIDAKSFSSILQDNFPVTPEALDVSFLFLLDFFETTSLV